MSVMSKKEVDAVDKFIESQLSSDTELRAEFDKVIEAARIVESCDNDQAFLRADRY